MPTTGSTFDPVDPLDVEIFTIDWKNLLATGETVQTVSVAVTPDTLTEESTGTSGTTSSMQYSGFTAGTTYNFSVTITTSVGTPARTLNRDFTVRCKDL